ncbi:hypothetical protein [Neisseria sp.]|uniref:hypothetical protein n=1 Tax=Neisseria sp. TaxID=192066 RepID=UPI00359FE8E6
MHVLFLFGFWLGGRLKNFSDGLNCGYLFWLQLSGSFVICYMNTAIPAQAGIQAFGLLSFYGFQKISVLDSRLRGNDGVYVSKYSFGLANSFGLGVRVFRRPERVAFKLQQQYPEHFFQAALSLKSKGLKSKGRLKTSTFLDNSCQPYLSNPS